MDMNISNRADSTHADGAGPCGVKQQEMDTLAPASSYEEPVSAVCGQAAQVEPKTDQAMPSSDDASGDAEALFKVNLGCLKVAKERGAVSAVAFLLAAPEFRLRSSADKASQTFLAETERWLSDAIAYEEKNGRRSMLDEQHPLNIQIRIDLRILAARKEAFRNTPASNTYGS